MGSLMSGGPPGGGIGRPGSLLTRARAASAAGATPTPGGQWVPNPHYTGDASPPMMFMMDNPTPAPAAAGAPAGAVPAMQQAVQAAAAAAAGPAPGVVAFPISPTVLGTLGETGAAAGGTGPTASTAPTSRRRRAPTRGRTATLLSGSETAETLGA